MSESAPSTARPSDRLVDAATEVLAEDGWEGLTLQAVAARAGVSRVTVWRQATSRELLAAEMINRLAVDYRETLWPILTGPGTGAERLGAALAAMCDVADRHLPLLLASDSAFRQSHAEVMHAVGFTEPIVRLIRDGVADGSIAGPADPAALGDVVFNATYWPYIHLRGRHRWSARDARAMLLPLIQGGIREVARAGAPAASRPAEPAAGSAP
ncbi:MAG: TetR/AcrR family transcriptional regulator [Candidatus Dormiibacterota bacterium]